MPTGLIRRGARYSLRRRIPLDLVGHYGKQEITLALGTSDPKEARRLLPLKWSLLNEEFERLRDQNSEAAEVVEKPISELSPTLIALVNLDTLRDERDAAAKVGNLGPFIQQKRDALRLVQAMLDGERRATDDLRVLEGQRNALRALLTGENAFSVSAARKARQALSEAQNQERRFVTTTWDQLINRWAVERKKDAKSRKAHEAVARWFSERVGQKRIEEITKRDVLEFKNALLKEGVSASNINVKLTRLRTLLNYAHDNDLIAYKPATGIRVLDTEAGRNKRKPFDLPALEKLFNGPVHAAGARPTGGKGEAAYWLPLLALYTGARMEELGQLRPSDVTLTAYAGSDGGQREAWCIQITSDDGDGLKLKNAGSERTIPVHPELERLGLVGFCTAAKTAKQDSLFPALKPNVHGRLTAKWGEWFSTYLRNVCGVTDKRIVFHSFRHTFKDYARNSGIAEGVQRQLMGHAGKDVADGYGQGYGLHQLVEGIRSYRVAGFQPSSQAGLGGPETR